MQRSRFLNQEGRLNNLPHDPAALPPPLACGGFFILPDRFAFHRRFVMEKTNVQIFREYIEQVINAKHLDLLNTYLSEQCQFYSPPYVGIGIVVDTTSGERVIAQTVVPHGPSTGHILVGDEIVTVQDSHHTWDSFDALKSSLWGQGAAGSPVQMAVRRAGKMIYLPLVRGRVEPFCLSLSEIINNFRSYLLEECPDLHAEINLLIAEGNVVPTF
jgi:hypothetical protein